MRRKKRIPWQPKPRLECQYEKSLKQLLDRIVNILKVQATEAAINAAVSQVTSSKWFQSYANNLAAKMVETAAIENASTWREAAKQAQGSRGRQIYEGLRREFNDNARFAELARQNASLIKSIPAEMAEKAIKLSNTEAIAGRRAGGLMQELLKQNPNLSAHKARVIARTEIAKTQAAIVQVRAERIGIYWYEWNTSEDQRVRTSHKNLDKVLCRYDDPPPPEALIGEKSTLGHYNPGGCPNCRCFSAPLTEPYLEQWPKRVYRGGKIQRMTLGQFQSVS